MNAVDISNIPETTLFLLVSRLLRDTGFNLFGLERIGMFKSLRREKTHQRPRVVVYAN